jgi:hypothetical protein
MRPALAAGENLELTLETDKTIVYPNELITLRLKVENSGKTPYYRVRVECEWFGGLGQYIGTLKAGQTYAVTKTIELKSATTFKYYLLSYSAAAKRVEMTSNELTVFVCPAASDVKLRVEAETESASIPRPGEVDFTVKLINDSDLELRNVVLSEVTRGEIRELFVVPIGEIPGLTQRYTVSDDAVFQFAAAVADPSGTVVTVKSEPIYIDVIAHNNGPNNLAKPAVDYAPIRHMLIRGIYIAGVIFIILSAVYLISGLRSRDKRRKAR